MPLPDPDLVIHTPEQLRYAREVLAYRAPESLTDEDRRLMRAAYGQSRRDFAAAVMRGLREPELGEAMTPEQEDAANSSLPGPGNR